MTMWLYFLIGIIISVVLNVVTMLMDEMLPPHIAMAVVVLWPLCIVVGSIIFLFGVLPYGITLLIKRRLSRS